MKTYQIYITRKSGMGIVGFNQDAESAEEAVNKFLESYTKKDDVYEITATRIESEQYTWKSER